MNNTEVNQTNMNQNIAKKSGKGWLYAIILLLFGSNVATIYMWLNEKTHIKTMIVEKERVVTENISVKNDLLQLKTDFAALQTNDTKLNAELEVRKKQIDELIIEANKNKGNAVVIAKLRKETETLRAIMKGYLVQIDSLNTLNNKLIGEKKEISTQLESEKSKTEQLNKEKGELNRTISTASILKAYNIKAEAVKFKSDGKKEISTTRASRTEKIKVSFTLGENLITKAGGKDVFIRIVSPDGKEMAKGYDDNYRFNMNGGTSFYAGKQSVNYSNAEVTASAYCEGQGEFIAGKYIIEVSADGAVIGNTTLELK
jgi:hypothetical protein